MKKYKGFCVDNNLNIYNEISGNLLKPFKGTDGYMQVSRKTKGKSYHLRVHRIYAILFISNPNDYKYVNHIDGNKMNNNLSNLEWCTNSYNVKHSWDNLCKGRSHSFPIEVSKNGKIINIYPSIRKLSEDLNIDRHKVSRILQNKLKNTTKYTFKYYLES